MTTANAVPALIRADAAGNLYYSLDGGVTFSAASAGSGPIANNTVLGNISGSSAEPAALTKAQLTALINPATASLPGAISASDFAFIDGWYSQQQAWLTTKCSGFTTPPTEFGSWKAGVVGNGQAGNGSDGGLEGGAITPTTGGTNATQLSTGTIWQAPKTSGFCLVVRASFQAVSSNIQMIGLINPAVSNWAAIALSTSLDATKLCIRISDGTDVKLATTVADASVHDYALIFDPVAASFDIYQDQVKLGSQTTITHLPNVALAPQLFNVSAGIKALKAIWGYVAA